ncbi:hypothetical protein PHET_09215 [Paragonimus heterotremus]|uniref:Uncharacterized protein n=1 Tax=Paragonimus heterotremus TaxID=100268 RepID=A0A8J4SIY9_9TREM|nr:hypothetical protein PHET_09215 [Paragonimus heterotremus]
MVRMRDLTTNAVWLWEREKFLGRRFLMQEMYQSYLNKGHIANISKEEDPYWDVLEDRLLGVAPAFLQALGYRLDVDDKLAVTGIEGEEVGTLSFQLIPCTRSGKPWSELDASGSGHSDFVDDPNELLGQPFHFKIGITDLDILKACDQTKVTIRYRVFKETDWTIVEFPRDYFRGGTSIRHLIDHTRLVSISQMTFEHLDYLANHCICFMVYVSQTEDAKNHMSSAKEVSSIVRSVQASRRYSRVQGEEYCDVNRLKTELTLIQRSLDRHMAVGEQLRDLCESWSKKKPTSENCEKLLQALRKIVDTKNTIPRLTKDRSPLGLARSSRFPAVLEHPEAKE